MAGPSLSLSSSKVHMYFYERTTPAKWNRYTRKWIIGRLLTGHVDHKINWKFVSPPVFSPTSPGTLILSARLEEADHESQNTIMNRVALCGDWISPPRLLSDRPFIFRIRIFFIHDWINYNYSKTSKVFSWTEYFALWRCFQGCIFKYDLTDSKLTIIFSWRGEATRW